MMNLEKYILLSFVILSLLFTVLSTGFIVPATATPDLITMTATINGTWWFDIDTGQNVLFPDPATITGDLQWEQVTSTERHIVPKNGAEFANLGIVDFDLVLDCSIYALSTAPINGSVGNNTIPDGTVLVVKTNIENYAKMRIDQYGYDLEVTIVYQDNGSPILLEQNTLTLETSSKDAQIDTDKKDTNYGANPRLDFGATAYGRVLHSLIQFDLPPFLSDVTITSAILRLWGPIGWSGAEPSGEAVRICRVTHDWVEGTGNGSILGIPDGVTWNEYDYYDGLTTVTNNWDMPGGDYTLTDSSTAIVPLYPQPSWGTMNWTVTNIVKGWLSGSYPNCGVLVKLDNESAAKGGVFGSKEYQLIAPSVPPPKLEITYIIPTIESCDLSGDQKDHFELGETVFVKGSGFQPSTAYSLHIVMDQEIWTDGMPIPERVLGTESSMVSDAYGNIDNAHVWHNAQTIGNYDIVVDMNGNGQYDAGLDALDDGDVEITAGFAIAEFQLFLMLPLFIIATLLAVTLYKKKHACLRQ